MANILLIFLVNFSESCLFLVWLASALLSNMNLDDYLLPNGKCFHTKRSKPVSNFSKTYKLLFDHGLRDEELLLRFGL